MTRCTTHRRDASSAPESHVSWTFSASELFLQRFCKITGEVATLAVPIHFSNVNFLTVWNALNTPMGLWTFSHLFVFLSRVLFRPCVKCVLRFYKQRENKKYQRTEVNSTPNNGCESVILGDTAGRVALKNLAFPIFACVWSGKAERTHPRSASVRGLARSHGLAATHTDWY